MPAAGGVPTGLFRASGITGGLWRRVDPRKAVGKPSDLSVITVRAGGDTLCRLRVRSATPSPTRRRRPHKFPP